MRLFLNDEEDNTFIEGCKVHHDALYRYIYHGVGNRKIDADDVFQEFAYKAWKGRHTIRDMRKLRSWLYKIAGNQLKDYYRKRMRNESQETLYTNETIDDMTDDLAVGNMEDAINHLAGKAFLDRLTPYQSAILTLYIYYGYPARIVASIVGVKQKTLESQLNKLINQMAREIYGDE